MPSREIMKCVAVVTSSHVRRKHLCYKTQSYSFNCRNAQIPQHAYRFFLAK